MMSLSSARQLGDLGHLLSTLELTMSVWHNLNIYDTFLLTTLLQNHFKNKKYEIHSYLPRPCGLLTLVILCCLMVKTSGLYY